MSKQIIQRAVVPPAAPVTPASNGGGFSAGAVSLTLPYPPSVNTYWRRHGNRYFISKAGKLFRQAVLTEVESAAKSLPAGDIEWSVFARLRMVIELFPGDRRRRDVDNSAKAVLDSLAFAVVYPDDEQIDELIIRRREVSKPGYCTVLVEEI